MADIKIIESHSAEETFALGEKIGQTVQKGTVFTLNGDLGVGKTVFTQGVAKGLGIDGPVSSPKIYYCSDIRSGATSILSF